jgi:hypothetical protein
VHFIQYLNCHIAAGLQPFTSTTLRLKTVFSPSGTVEVVSACGVSSNESGFQVKEATLPVTDAFNRADSPERTEVSGGENVITGVSFIVTVL